MTRSTASERRLGQRLSKAGGSRLIHHQHDGQLPLFRERLDVGTGQPGRHVPVDCAEVVTVLVGPDLGELHPLPSEYGAVLAGKQGTHQPPGAELDGFDLLQDFGSDRIAGHELGAGSYGTLTAPSTRVTTSSVVTSSASASKVSTMRCRKTSGASARTSSGTT